MSQNIYHPHDHAECMDEAMQYAETVCQQQGARLTPVRRRVLELIWKSHKPIGAYELLPILAEEGFNSAPPTVYRALDFLLDLGLVHRLTSINAYVGCSHPGLQHPVCFFICKTCGKAQELDYRPLMAFAEQVEIDLKVKVEHQVTELKGQCPSCLSESA